MFGIWKTSRQEAIEKGTNFGRKEKDMYDEIKVKIDGLIERMSALRGYL